MYRHVTALILFAALVPAVTLCQEANPGPVKAYDHPGPITTLQQVTPAGIQTYFDGDVYGTCFDRENSAIWVLTSKEVVEFNWRTNSVLERIAVKGVPGLQGIKCAATPNQVLYTEATKSTTRKSPLPYWKYEIPGNDVQLFSAGAAGQKLIASNIGTEISGALDVAADTAVIPLIRDNQIVVVALDGHCPEKRISTGIAPYGVVLSPDAKVAWISDWGGRKPRPGERTAATGELETSDRVLVDARGIASSGTLNRVDLTTNKITQSLEVGLHPTAMVWDHARNRLYVATTNQDSVTVVDTSRGSIVSKIDLQPFPMKVAGVAPTALAVSNDGTKLYVACGGINAVMVIDVRTQKIDGMIPTGWYPDTITISQDGSYLAIGTLFGHGSGWKDSPTHRYSHSSRGSMAIVPTPDAAQLASYTRAVAENNHMDSFQNTVAEKALPLPIPLRVGDSSLIKHVIYIIKENRTYDQVFGDMPEGNGDPNLVMFGEDVTPNHHRLAREFTLFDNFYVAGRDSADGHQWITQSNETSYAMLHGYLGRSYPSFGSDPIAYSNGGFLWDEALNAKEKVRVYGEFAGHMPETELERMSLLNRWKSGDDFTHHWNVNAAIAPLNDILAHNFPTAAGCIPDQIRADLFIHDLKEWEQSGNMPNLIYMDLPSDHTLGAYPGTSTPEAMLADNDLALGKIAEAVTHSKFWSDTAIFVVEDDAQGGVDHVDGHRTVALAISPYTRRGYVDSTFYSQTSMMKTIELILGLRPLSIFDRIANDMRPAFQDQIDLTPYTSVVPKQSLYDINPPLKATTGEARKAAEASLKMRWDVPDANPEGQLNRIIWHQVRGWNVPYPEVKQGVFITAAPRDPDDER